jgi:hypothetical protein
MSLRTTDTDKQHVEADEVREFSFLRSLTHGEFSNYTISYGEKPKASPKHAVSEAMDKINDRWGEFVITPALMMGMQDVILDRIAFGGVKELQELYTE